MDSIIFSPMKLQHHHSPGPCLALTSSVSELAHLPKKAGYNTSIAFTGNIHYLVYYDSSSWPLLVAAFSIINFKLSSALGNSELQGGFTHLK